MTSWKEKHPVRPRVGKIHRAENLSMAILKQKNPTTKAIYTREDELSEGLRDCIEIVLIFSEKMRYDRSRYPYLPEVASLY
jgi:hypothetical protein